MQKIESVYQYLANKPSDINEHLPTLMKYAKECESVFETGVRGCISSWAFVYGLLNNNKNNKYILLNDINTCDINELLQCSKDLPITIEYEWKNNLNLNMTRNVDLTFIDTWHVYGQLIRELRKFSPITNKYIILHDTTVDEWKGESIRAGWDTKKQAKISGFPEEEIRKGLWYAVEEFLNENKEWILHERFKNNNGLTVLKRI
jgi:hypothetical protein